MWNPGCCLLLLLPSPTTTAGGRWSINAPLLLTSQALIITSDVKINVKRASYLTAPAALPPQPAPGTLILSFTSWPWLASKIQGCPGQSRAYGHPIYNHPSYDISTGKMASSISITGNTKYWDYIKLKFFLYIFFLLRFTQPATIGKSKQKEICDNLL